MTKNATKKIVKELVHSGYEIAWRNTHGIVLRRDGNIVTVPYRVRTQKLSRIARNKAGLD